MRLHRGIDIIEATFSILLGTLVIFLCLLYMFGAHHYIFPLIGSAITVSGQNFEGSSDAIIATSSGNSFAHPVDEYRDWGIQISSCQEHYFAESDHTAFGEGNRYSVLSGPVAFSAIPQNTRGEKITRTAGSGADQNAVWFLSDVWYALDVPVEQRCSLALCDWTTLSTEDGSRILVAISKPDHTVYVAESLL